MAFRVLPWASKGFHKISIGFRGVSSFTNCHGTFQGLSWASIALSWASMGMHQLSSAFMAVCGLAVSWDFDEVSWNFMGGFMVASWGFFIEVPQ